MMAWIASRRDPDETDGVEMDGRHGNLFLIAARAPVPHETKTRLGVAIGMDRAATLYRAFLRDLADRFTPVVAAGEEDEGGDGSAAGFDLGWAFTPADHDFRRVLREIGAPPQPAAIRFVPQEGDGWGARQANLLRWGHEHGYARTILVASDSPQLPACTPGDAFALLADHDVALGRVHDGGYYLTGLRGFHDVFTGVPMSTASAADALAGRAATLGLCLAELPATFDVDDVADLDVLRSHLAPDGVAAPATWAALGEVGGDG